MNAARRYRRRGFTVPRWRVECVEREGVMTGERETRKGEDDKDRERERELEYVHDNIEGEYKKNKRQ